MYFGTINVRVDKSATNRIANFSGFYNQSLRLHWHGTFFAFVGLFVSQSDCKKDLWIALHCMTPKMGL